MKKTKKIILALITALAVGTGFSIPAAASAGAAPANLPQASFEKASATEAAAVPQPQKGIRPAVFRKAADSDYNVITDGEQLSLTKTNLVYFESASSNAAILKVKPKKTGALIISAAGAYGSGSTTLLNGKKKALSGISYVDVNSSDESSRFVTYGVKANKTYYLKIYFYTPISENGYYYGIVSARSAKYAAKAGSSKKKAAGLKKKKAVKGVLLADSSKSKWYKFTTRSKNTNVHLETANSYGVRFTVYQKVRGKTVTIYTSFYREGAKAYKGWGSRKANQTYWIKITPLKDPSKKTSSGIYMIKWTK